MDRPVSDTIARATRPEPNERLRTRAYEAMKRSIASMDIYSSPEDIRLDERQISEELGVSRTPVREAMSILEQEGFVRSAPRRGVFVVRKTKAEIIEMIHAWAALESMAARLAATRAKPADIRRLKALFDAVEDAPATHLSEYSDANIRFHQAIIALGDCALIERLSENLFIHVRAIRAVSIRQGDRLERSLAEHDAILAALLGRDADRAQILVRDHALGLAAHVERHGLLR